MPTTAHIAERIIGEAKALLQYTDWNIADIAYALGFEYPSYFTITSSASPAPPLPRCARRKFEILNHQFDTYKQQRKEPPTFAV